MQYQTVMNKEEVSDYVREVFAQADVYNWTIEELEAGEISLSMTTSEKDIRPGGTISGPTMFALADITAYILILAHVGKVALAVTTSLNINFLNKPEPEKLFARGRFIKLGKRLAVCEVHIYSGSKPNLVAQATATYSIPPR